MYNPWSAWPTTGTWEEHSSYSEGGTDWPLPYGTALRAPAAGRLVSNGWVGSAGRRATLHLDEPVRRVRARSTTSMLGGYVEHDCDMVAFVFQHAKGYLGDGWYALGALVGFSGASANESDWGGDVHLHAHGLCVHGARVDFAKFIGSSIAGIDANLIEEDDMFESADRDRAITTLNLLKEQQARNVNALVAPIVSAILAGKVSDKTGTVAQTLRDGRQAARRTEVKVDALAALVSALSTGRGIDPVMLKGIVDDAVNAAVEREVEEVTAAVADIDDRVMQALEPLLNSGASADEIVAAIKAQWAK